MAGDLDTHDWICSALAQLSSAMVLSVAYRQPPEVPQLGPAVDKRQERLGTKSNQDRRQNFKIYHIIITHNPL